MGEGPAGDPRSLGEDAGRRIYVYYLCFTALTQGRPRKCWLRSIRTCRGVQQMCSPENPTRLQAGALSRASNHVETRVLSDRSTLLLCRRERLSAIGGS